MTVNKKFFICAMLVLMLFLCVNASSATEPLNQTLGTDIGDAIAISDVSDDELSASGDTLVVDENGGVQNTSISAAVGAANGGDGPVSEPAVYDVYVSPDGDGDGSSYDTPTTFANALMMELVPEGGTMFLCNGEYEIPDPWFIYSSMHFVGESRDDVVLSVSQGFAIADYNDPYDSGYSVDSISFSHMTFVNNGAQWVLIVSCNVNELNVTDCLISTDNFIALGTGVMGEPMGTSGTLNFKKNIVDSVGFDTIYIRDYWTANINDNFILNSDPDLINVEGGNYNIDYNYWGADGPATTLDVDDYVDFTAYSDVTEIYTDETAEITIEAVLSDGTTNAKDHLPDYPIEATLSAAGDLSENQVTLQNGAADVTYSSNVARNDNVRINVLGKTLTVPVKVKEKYAGIIYVATTGSDDNEGSQSAPVASIAKAIELADAGAGKIILLEGTYVLDSTLFPTKDLDITGQGVVIIDGNRNRFIQTTAGLNLTNIEFTNGYSSGSNLINLASGGTYLSLDKVKFYNNGGKYGVAAPTDKRLIINNSEFYDNNLFAANQNSLGVIYSNSAITTIENTIFRNNTAQRGGGIWANKATSATIGGVVDIINCTFDGNIAQNGNGAAIFMSGSVTVTVSNSTFTNNLANASANGAGGYGSAVYIGTGTGKITITQSVFINNTGNGENNNDAGFYIGAGTLDVSDSIILTNDGDTRYAINFVGGSVTAENNWWGNNNEANTNAVVNEIVTMDAIFTPYDAQAGEDVTITALFSNANLPDGIEVAFTSTSGNLNTVVSTVDAQASTTYTIDANDMALTVTSGSAVVEMPIVKEPNFAEIIIDAEPVWIGSNAIVCVTVPNATGTVTIEVNNKSYGVVDLDNGAATKEIAAEDLIAGENAITVTYEGPEFETTTATGALYVLNGVVNQENYLCYFNQEDNGKFFDYVPEGTTLDFQGSIINPDQSITVQMNVNKPVNIVSTTKDGYVDLNTTAGSLMGESPGNSFAITNGGSGTNVTGIYFHNTQLWLANTHNVVLDNISAVVEDQRIGSGNGATSIRENSTYVTVKNSYFYTRNNGGSSSLVLSWADYCTWDNNTIEVSGNVGNMLYLNTFNVNIPSGVVANCHNVLTNNVIIGPETAAGICCGIVINGQDNLVENNTIYYKGIGIASASGGTVDSVTYRGNKLYNGSTIGGFGNYKNCTFEDNYISGAATIGQDCKLYNNTFDGKLTINKANVVAYNNTINNVVTISASNITFEGNDVTGTVTVSADGNRIVNNTIITSSANTVDLKAKKNNNVTGNILYAASLTGDGSVKYSDASNIVKDNYPRLAEVFVEATDVFEGQATTITVTVPDATGNVTIRVNGREAAVVDLTDGVATFETDGYGDNFTVSATYNGDLKYLPNTNVTEFGLIGNVVTNATFYTYFDYYGNLRDVVPYDELIFEGEFSDLDVYVTIDRALTITGDDAVLNDIGFIIAGEGVTLDNMTLVANSDLGNLIDIAGENAVIKNMAITYIVSEAASAIEVRPYANGVQILNNSIYFESTVDDYAVDEVTTAICVNSGVSLFDEEDPIEGLVIDGNNITAVIPAFLMDAYENEYYVMGLSAVNGVRINGAEKFKFTNNKLDVTTNRLARTTPTLQALYVASSSGLIDGNNISMIDTFTPEGKDVYLYAVELIKDEELTISNNNFNLSTAGGKDEAGSAYAIFAIDSEFEVTDNNITTVSNGPNIGIWFPSHMGAPCDAVISGNFINVTGLATAAHDTGLVSGIEIQTGTVEITNNTIYAYNIGEYAEGNYIYGISFAQDGSAPEVVITDNTIYTEGHYAISFLEVDDATITDNYLISTDLGGDESVYIGEGSGNTVENNRPYKPIIIVVAIETFDGVATNILVDIANATGNVTFFVNGEEYANANLTEGRAALYMNIWGPGEYPVNVTYSGDANYLPGWNTTTLSNLGNVITNDTFFKYFDENGLLKEAVPFDELIFNGTFSDLTDMVVFNRAINVAGENAVLDNIAIRIASSDVSLSGFALNADKEFADNNGALIYATGANIEISDVVANYVAPSEAEAIAIYANDAENFTLINSEIIYEATNPGSNHNYGLELRDSNNANIENNTITAVLPAVDVSYGGNSIDDDLVLAVGIQGGNNVNFTANTVDVTTNGGVGYYPTIDAIMIYSTNNVLVNLNNITHIDTTTSDVARYYYSVDVHDTNGTIEYNNILVNTTSGIVRTGSAYPIQLTGPFTVTINNNNLTSISRGPNAGIYASNWNGPGVLTARDNTINITGYATAGGYALVAGIEGETDLVKVYNNTVYVYNLAGYDDTNPVYGVSMTSSYLSEAPSADIKDNTIIVDGKYAVYYVNAANTNVTDNTLYAHELKGDDAAAIDSGDNNIIENNIPAKANITIEAIGTWAGGNAAVGVSVPNATGTVTIEINSKSYVLDLVDGAATKEIPAEDLVLGENIVTATYEGPEFASNTNSAAFGVVNGVVTQDTYMYYFNQDDNGRLFDYVPDGATLDFQGSIINPDQANVVQMNVNKPVNIVSTTGNAYVDLNTTAGSLLGESPGNSFAITRGGSGTNVTGIAFHNTQLWISNTTNVVLDNISNVIEDQRVGSGVGATSVRDNSTYVTVKNSYFYTRNNGGSTTNTLSHASYCTFDNNTIKIEGTVGNAFYLNPYNVAGVPTAQVVNNYNNITNNRIYGKPGGGISQGIVIWGSYNLFENNTLYSCSIAGASVWGTTNPSGNNTFIGNDILNGGGLTAQPNSIMHDNNVTGGLTTGTGSVAYNNIVGGKQLTVSQDAKAYNNTVTAGVKTEGTDAVIENNTIAGAVTINKVGTVFVGNNVTGTVTVSANDNVIKGNNITSTGDYAVDLGAKTGNNVTDNYLVSSSHKGDAAVKYTNENNVVENNIPISTEIIIANDTLMLNVGDEVDTGASLTPVDAGDLTFTSSDESVAIVENGKIKALAEGTAIITVSFAGDDKYAAAEDKTITVNIAGMFIVGYDVNMTYEDGSAYMVQLVDKSGAPVAQANEAINITINGRTYTRLTDDSGIAKVTIHLNASTYEVTAQYGKCIINNVVTVNTLPIVGYDVNMIYEDGSAYMVQLVDVNGNPFAKSNEAIDITINGRTYTRYTNASGIAKVTIHLNASTYDVTAQYGNTIIHNTVIVNYLPIVACDVNMVYKDGSAYMVQLVDKDGNPFAKSNQAINITIAGKSYIRYTNASGVAKITINLAAGTYDVTAQYGDTIVNNVVTVNRYGLVASDVNMTYKDGSAYMVQLVDGNGDPVAKENMAVNITIDGRTYSRVTDANGVAKVTINLRAGEYPVIAQKDNVIIENVVTVNNKLSIAASDLVMTYKDGSAFEVQLVDENGNPCALANEPVKITIAGKTYTRSTNENGVARIVINLGAGTYPVTTEYNNKTLSNTITVNKA